MLAPKNYVIDYHELSTLPVSQISERILKTNGIEIKNCKIFDLVFCDEQPIYSGNGVYFFKDETKIIYIGSCSARNFVERVPAHFDIRRSGWFNSLLKVVVRNEESLKDDLNKITKKTNGKIWYDYTNEILSKAGRVAFAKYSLVLINFKNPDEEVNDADQYLLNVATILALESFLLASDIFQPHNKTNKPWKYKEDQILNEVLHAKIDANLDRLKKKVEKKAKTKQDALDEKGQAKLRRKEEKDALKNR